MDEQSIGYSYKWRPDKHPQVQKHGSQSFRGTVAGVLDEHGRSFRQMVVGVLDKRRPEFQMNHQPEVWTNRGRRTEIQMNGGLRFG